MRGVQRDFYFSSICHLPSSRPVTGECFRRHHHQHHDVRDNEETLASLTFDDRYRWIDYQYVDEETEREHIRKAVAITEKVCGKRPVGIYQGKPNINTRR